MWTVEIEKQPERGDFRAGFFPRKVYYKKDALALKKEVEDKGGEASIHDEKKGGKNPRTT